MYFDYIPRIIPLQNILICTEPTCTLWKIIFKIVVGISLERESVQMVNLLT